MNNNKFILGEVLDVFDNVLSHGWAGPKQVDQYFANCVKRGINAVGWRLSGAGNFLHHSQIENSPFSHYPFTSDGNKTPLHKHDFLKLGAEYARKHGIKFLPFITMCDEGWFPRFRYLSSDVENYYHSENFEFLVQNDDLKKVSGIPNLERWLEDPSEDEKNKYAGVIPAVEQGQHIPQNKPWGCYSQFAREHPEYLMKTRSGIRMGRMLSYAHEAVRQYKMDIFREIASYGCDGFILDYFRWSGDHDVPIQDSDGVAVTGYDEPSVDLFDRKYGKDAFKTPNNDPAWLKCRAEAGPTRFLEDLRSEFPDKLLMGMVPLNDPLKTAAFADVEDWAERNLLDSILVFNIQSRCYYDPLIFTSDYPEVVARYNKHLPGEWARMWMDRINGKLPVNFYIWPRYYDAGDENAGKYRQATQCEVYDQVKLFRQIGAAGAFFYQNYNDSYYGPAKCAANNMVNSEDFNKM